MLKTPIILSNGESLEIVANVENANNIEIMSHLENDDNNEVTECRHNKNELKKLSQQINVNNALLVKVSGTVEGCQTEIGNIKTNLGKVSENQHHHTGIIEENARSIGTVSSGMETLSNDLSDQVDLLIIQNRVITSTEHTMNNMDKKFDNPLQNSICSDIKSSISNLEASLEKQHVDVIHVKDSVAEHNTHNITLKNIEDTLKTQLEDISAIKETVTPPSNNTVTQEGSVDPESSISYSNILTSPTPGHNFTNQVQINVQKGINPKTTIVIDNVQTREYAKHSSCIKREFNKHFPNMKINSCFSTKFGSLMVELTSENDAKSVLQDWNVRYFTTAECRDKGNTKGTSVNILASKFISGIIEVVPKDIEDEDITEGINKEYSGACATTFVKRYGFRLYTVQESTFLMPTS